MKHTFSIKASPCKQDSGLPSCSNGQTFFHSKLWSLFHKALTFRCVPISLRLVSSACTLRYVCGFVHSLAFHGSQRNENDANVAREEVSGRALSMAAWMSSSASKPFAICVLDSFPRGIFFTSTKQTRSRTQQPEHLLPSMSNGIAE